MLETEDIQWVNGLNKQETHFRSKDTWAESKGVGKDIPCKKKQQQQQQQQHTWSSSTYIRQNGP